MSSFFTGNSTQKNTGRVANMSTNDILAAVFIALGFTIWPILGRYLQIGGAWTVTIITTASTLVTIFFVRRGLTPVPPLKSAVILIAAGVVNGIAMYLYIGKTSNQKMSTAAFMVMVSVFMVTCAPIIDWGLNGTSPDHYKILGFICAACAIYLLSR
jgi:drug/metabolite transporter (DMT)-like permease